MLSKRLNAVANYIAKEDRLVDIGCDHALLSIYLQKNNKASYILASDKNSNALQNAINNIKNNNLEKKIKTILSDGINNIDIKKNKINCLVISGMGSTTIINILKNEQVKYIDKLILQSNNDYYLLRRTIINQGFYIEDETITYDNKKYYLTINFKKGIKKYQEKDYLWGIVKSENKDYYKFLLENYQKIYFKIPNNKIIIKFKMKRLIIKLTKIIKKI